MAVLFIFVLVASSCLIQETLQSTTSSSTTETTTISSTQKPTTGSTQKTTAGSKQSTTATTSSPPCDDVNCMTCSDPAICDQCNDGYDPVNNTCIGNGNQPGGGNNSGNMALAWIPLYLLPIILFFRK